MDCQEIRFGCKFCRLEKLIGEDKKRLETFQLTFLRISIADMTLDIVEQSTVLVWYKPEQAKLS